MSYDRPSPHRDQPNVSSDGSVWVLLGFVLVLLLIMGGAGFYWVAQRQQQARSSAMVRALAAEAEADKQAAVIRLEAELAQARADARRSTDDAPAMTEGDDVSAAIEAVLRTQQEAWNRGDVDAFAEHYWKSEDLTFSSGGKTTRGWEETLRGYRERYPTREKMGRLEFGNLEITPLGDAAALVLGEWRLERGTDETSTATDGTGGTPVPRSETLSGNFSLIFRKLDGRWVIVHDHTSRKVP
jgi:ketosteroid isomerase-like protein